MFHQSPKIKFVALSLACLLTSGCAPKLGANDYGVSAVGDFSENHLGTLISKRVVRISGKETGDDNTPGLGAIAGAGAGALAGSQIGYGKGQVAGGVLGGLVAGVAGHYIEKALTEQDGFEYTVKLDDGRTVSIVQGAEPALNVGQRVRVVKSQGKTKSQRSRVLPA